MPLFKVLLISCLFLSSCASNQAQEEAELHLKVGTSYFMNGDYPQALTSLLRAEELDDENPAIQNNLGLVYFMREKYDLAEKHIRRALSLNSKYSDARNNLSRVLIERGEYKEAIQEANQVIEDLTYTSPEKPYIHRGIAHFRLRQIESAQKDFQQALKLQKENCLASSYFGRTYFEQKKFDRAAEELDRAAAFCQRGQFDEPLYFSGMALYRLGRLSQAEDRFNQIMKLYPNGKYREDSRKMLESLKR